MRILIPILFLLPISIFSQNKLSITVDGVKTSNGHISVAVYDRSESFLKFDHVFKSDSTRAKKGTTKIDIDDLPPGEYALAIFHDENGNNQLDTNILGVPKEPFAFSKGKMRTFGPPKFKDCVLSVQSDQEVRISF
ncbi:DUF2141 domain-containing protein [Zeaxanthinibacter sp. PT1]|uniref:DUF2141 domain-containing protein n=1 Tax=Zeaxanthinibacter TaxID=561554 RepID=UPI00234A0845|nr:DUF2141 domain-containing protein [Zeaxanthinibacter sp. PT1]MDC6350378.1 DUF2141 domain-containing protein [Zeaxanthinibacter sp. PT1]